MNNREKIWRRWFGGICLGLAVAMLIAGQTFLKSWLAQSIVGLVCFWMGCVVLTALAAGAAIIDAARVNQESREESRALIEKTLQEIEAERRSRKNSGPAGVD